MKIIELQTPRLTMNIVRLSDLSDVHELLSIPAVDKYNALGIPTNMYVTEVYLDEWIESYKMRKEFVFAIRSPFDKKFIGLLSLRIGNSKYNIGTIWYKLHPSFWSKGYATEGVKCILQFGFEEVGLHRIEAGCAIDNIGSIRVLEKSGMIKEGHKRKILPLAMGWSDTYEYAMLDQDWKMR